MPKMIATTATSGMMNPPRTSLESPAAVEARTASELDSESFEAFDAIAGDTASEQAATAIINLAIRMNKLPFIFASFSCSAVMP
jgi:hypothetical protein